MSKKLYPNFPILIVDDEDDILQTYKKLLRNNSINNIFLINDSREVLPYLEHNKVSLILLDLFMPHISGQELIKVIKKLHPQISVIIITGSTEIDDAVHCMKFGTVDYLTKPVEKSRFLTSIKNVLEMEQLKNEVDSLKKHFFDSKIENEDAFSNIISA